ncbi:MAG: nitrite/sulfite reductase, partial [Gemmatimonadetes bacterium]|nr:nitrite/sulfite reductase [Gemmatimonadota bacterium]
MTHNSGTPAPGPRHRSVIPILRREIDDFEREVGRFRNGEWEPAEFIAFRLRQGVYGQRQPDRYMVRVKAPFGGLTADQMDVLGLIAARYAPLKKGHVTTRENVQFHHVRLEDTHEILCLLADAGISTREACGNTVRNVTGSPTAGVARDEVFDPTPYAGAYARYFVRMDLTQNLPRKIKTAFVGSDRDEAVIGIHDIGFKSVIRNGTKGFRMTVGGGLSTMPRTALTLYEFVPVDEYLRVAEACLRVFNRSREERKDRMRARLKFMIDRIGIEEFRHLVETELDGGWAKAPVDLDALLWLDDEEADAPSRA